MKSWHLVVSVVGVLLIGGATTGTTYAAWADGRRFTAQSVSSGSLTSVATLQSGSLAGIVPGESRAVVIAVRNDGVGKNLRMVGRLGSVSGLSLPNLSLRVKSLTGLSDPCTPSVGGLTDWLSSATTITPDLPAGQTGYGCLIFTRSALATGSASTVSLSVSGHQTRGGSLAGWSTAAASLSLAATPVPAAPRITSCSITGAWLSLEWSNTGADSYRVYRGATGASPTTLVQSVTDIKTKLKEGDTGGSGTLAVRAVVNGVESANSNVANFSWAPSCSWP